MTRFPEIRAMVLSGPMKLGVIRNEPAADQRLADLCKSGVMDVDEMRKEAQLLKRKGREFL